MVFRWNRARCPAQVGFQSPHVGVGRRHGRLGGRDLLRPRAGLEVGQGMGGLLPSRLGRGLFFLPRPGQQLVQRRLGGLHFGTTQIHVALKIGRIEFGHQLALLDHLAFVEESLLDAAGDFEGHLGLGRLDIARDANLPVGAGRGRRRRYQYAAPPPADKDREDGQDSESSRIMRRRFSV